MLTGLQIVNEIEDRLGWTQSSTLEGRVPIETRKILGLLNRVLKNMGIVEQWPMLRAEGTLLTQAGVSTDMLLDVTNGSDIVNISTYDNARAVAAGETPFTFDVSHKQWAIQIGANNTPIYRIAEILLPSQIRLNRVWIGDTATATSVDSDTLPLMLGMDQYVLPEDFDRPTGKWQDFLSVYKVSPCGPEEFDIKRRESGRTITLDQPQYFTIYGLDPSESYQILHLHPWPIEQTMLEYKYQRLHPKLEQDVDHVLFPQTNLGMIIECVIYLANRDYEDDTRMQAAMMEYMQQLKNAKSVSMVVSDRKRLSPWRGNRARSVRSMHGDSGVRYDFGDYFDVAGNVKLP